MSSFSSFEKDKKIFDDWRRYCNPNRTINEWWWRSTQTKDTPGKEEEDAASAKPMLQKILNLLDSIRNAGEAMTDENKLEAFVSEKIQTLGLTDFAARTSQNEEALTNIQARIESGQATFGDFLDFIQEMVTYIVNKDIIDQITQIALSIMKDFMGGGAVGFLKKLPLIGTIVKVADTSEKLLQAYQIAQGLTTDNVEQFKKIMMRPDGNDPHPILSYINMDDAYEEAFGTNDKLMNKFIGFFLDLKDEMGANKDKKMASDFVDEKFRQYVQKDFSLDAAPLK